MTSYFAYGSNMSEDILLRVCPSATVTGPARLTGRRLAFTRKSRTWDAGAADIVPHTGYSVWGVVYEIDDDCLAALDRKEGAPNAYARVRVEVQIGEKSIQAITYEVADRSGDDHPPKSEYIDLLVAGATEHGLPLRYREFLDRLRTPGAADGGLLVKPTVERDDARGTNIVIVHRSEHPSRSRAVVAVQFRDRFAPVEAVVGPVEEGSCLLDQSVRNALGLGGREAYGERVDLHVLGSRRRLTGWFRPRTLLLPLHRPSILDSEKKICVLSQSNIDLLGLDEGDYVTLDVVVPSKDRAGVRLQRLTRRVYRGSTTTIHRAGEQIPYPSAREFYLDLDGRLALGMRRDAVDVPVVIAPSVTRLAGSRLLRYGAALFAALLVLPAVFTELQSLLGLTSHGAVLVGIASSVALTMLFTLVDLWLEVRY